MRGMRELWTSSPSSTNGSTARLWSWTGMLRLWCCDGLRGKAESLPGPACEACDASDGGLSPLGRRRGTP